VSVPSIPCACCVTGITGTWPPTANRRRACASSPWIGSATPSPAPAPTHDTDPTELDRFLGAGFGIFSGSAQAWAVLRFGPDASRWVADETWHPDQIGQWIDAHYQLQIPYADPRELLMDILKYGPEVEVIAPPDLREMVTERLRAGAERYSRGKK